MTGVKLTGEEPHTIDLSPAAPDWHHDPRELADSVERRAARRRRSRIGAVVVGVLLVLASGWYFGFVTGQVAIPGLGTLTQHPADVSAFTVGDTTYLMHLDGQAEDTVVVSRQVGSNSQERLVGLPAPGSDTVSVAVVPNAPTANPARSTYVAVLPAGAHSVMPEPKDHQMSVVAIEGVVRTSRPGSPLLGMVVTVDPPDGTPRSLTQPGLSSITWTDSDEHLHVSPVTS